MTTEPKTPFFQGQRLSQGQRRPLDLADMYRGAPAFLVLNGPSHRSLDLSRLQTPGLISMGINNGPRSVRPDLWLTCDLPGRFLPSIWRDPRILKFVRAHHHGRPIRKLTKKNGEPDTVLARDCPNVVWFDDSCRRLDTATFLDSPKVVFGNPQVRSGMLAAFKVLYLLGIREVYLVGCDFQMKEERPYGFFEPVSRRHVEKNNRNYELLQKIFAELQPHFLDRGFRVFNCNPDSHLRAFPFFDFDQAISAVADRFTALQEKEEVTPFYYHAVAGQSPGRTRRMEPPGLSPEPSLQSLAGCLSAKA